MKRSNVLSVVMLIFIASAYIAQVQAETQKNSVYISLTPFGCGQADVWQGFKPIKIYNSTWFALAIGETITIYPKANAGCHFDSFVDGAHTDLNDHYVYKNFGSKYNEVVKVIFHKDHVSTPTPTPKPTPKPTPPPVLRNIHVAMYPYGGGEVAVTINGSRNMTLANSTTIKVPVGDRLCIAAKAYRDYEVDIIIDGIDASLNGEYCHVAGESNAVITTYFRSTKKSSKPGDLDGNDGVNESDLDLMLKVSVGEIVSNASEFDLNNNGVVGDAGDLWLMVQAAKNGVSLPSKSKMKTLAPDSGVEWNGTVFTVKIPENTYILQGNDSVGWTVKSSLITERWETEVRIERDLKNNSWRLFRKYLTDTWYSPADKGIFYSFGQGFDSKIEKNGQVIRWQLSEVSYPGTVTRTRYVYLKSLDSNRNELLFLYSIEVILDERDKSFQKEIPYLGITYEEWLWMFMPDIGMIEFEGVAAKAAVEEMSKLAEMDGIFKAKFPLKLDVSKMKALPNIGMFRNEKVLYDAARQEKGIELFNKYFSSPSFEQQQTAQELLKFFQEEVVLPKNVKAVVYTTDNVPRNEYLAAVEEVVIKDENMGTFWSFMNPETGAKEITLQFDALSFKSYAHARAAFHRAVQNAYDLSGPSQIPHSVFNVRGYLVEARSALEDLKLSQGNTKFAMEAAESTARSEDWLRNTEDWIDLITYQKDSTGYVDSIMKEINGFYDQLMKYI